MRLKKEKESISYDETKKFFSRRAAKYMENHPYSVTMYQDSHPELAEERNRKETEKLLPLLKLDKDARVLDIACGIGRWSDAITGEICEYCGVDFSEDLIHIAIERNKAKENRTFLVAGAGEIERVLEENQKGKFNRLLMIGILMYLNDDDVRAILTQLERIVQDDAVICIREPIATEERLTLKDFFSEELSDSYNAIYRTRDELVEMFEQCLIPAGFEIEEEDYLFSEDGLNNRKETTQYYFVLRKNGGR